MQYDVGFNIPRDILNKEFIKWGLFSFLGIPLFVVVQVASGKDTSNLASVVIGSLATLLVVVGLGYLYVRQFCYVYLAPEGIKGRNSLGREVLLGWQEPVVMRTVSRQWIKGMRITHALDRSLSITIPTPIIERTDFREMIQERAPNHALLKLGADATPNQ